jgi:hypothetical protein
MPPNRYRIGGELLDLIYNELRSEIRDILTKQPLLNFTLDESIDLAGHRIINFAANIPRLCLFNLGTYDCGRIPLDAAYIVLWTYAQLNY